MFNQDLKRLVVCACDQNDKDALRWCVAKPDKRKPRKMTCKPFAKLVYEQLGWNTNQRYKMLGYPIKYQGKKFFVFDLLVPDIYEEKSKEVNKSDTPVNTRKGYYSEDVSNTFGLPVDDHINETIPTELDGYVSIGLLTGDNKQI